MPELPDLTVYIEALEQRIRGVQEEAGLAETGRVLSVGYGKNSSVHQLIAKTTS